MGVGMVIMNECTIHVEPRTSEKFGSCPCCSNGHFCGLMRCEGVHPYVFRLVFSLSGSGVVGTVATRAVNKSSKRRYS